MLTSEEPLTVVGAGLVGSLLSVLLARRGFRVRVFEARPDPRDEPAAEGRSTHLVISERGWTALRAVEFDDVARSRALPLRGRMIHSDGGDLSFQPYGDGAQTIWAISRAVLNAELIKLALHEPGVEVAFRRRCQRVDFSAGLLRMTDGHTGETEEIHFDRLFGADGAFSKVRASMRSLDRYDYSQAYGQHGYKELRMPARGDTWPLRSDLMHVWPRRRCLLTAFPNPDRSFTPSVILPFSGPFPSFETITDQASLMELFERFFPDALPLMPDLAHDYFQHPTGSVVTIRCRPWTWQTRALLLGDAAHTMVPFLGQGMNAGFEDCTVLDRLVAKYGNDWGRIFATFDETRRPDCDAVTTMSLRNFVELSEKVGDPTFLLRKKLEHKAHDLVPDRFIPLYSMIAFTTIGYASVLRIADEQDAVIQQLMQLPHVEERWDTDEFEGEIRRRVECLPVRKEAR